MPSEAPGSGSSAGPGPERALVFATSLVATAAVVAIGGVHPVTQLVLSAALLGVTAGALFIRRRRGLALAPFVLVAIVALAWTIVQLLPLPGFVVKLVSPHAYELRSEVGTTGFMPLTLDSAETLLAVVRGFACLGALATIAMLGRPLKRAHWALWPLALVGGGLALVAFIERIAGAQTILGFYRIHSMPGSGFCGTFVNGNHAASVFALSGLIAVGLGLEQTGARRFLLWWSAALSLIGLLTTTSRGGALGLAVGGTALAVMLIGRRAGRLQGAIAGCVLLLFASGAALWFSDGLRARLLPANTAELWNNQKTRGWRDGLVLARNYAITGVGRGAFEAPLNAYRENDEGVRLVYPENLLVQMAAEWGLPVTLVLLGLGLASARTLARRVSRLEAGTLGAACGVVAVLVHEMTDFGLEMPGVALPTVVALGVVVARWKARANDDQAVKLSRARSVYCGAAACAWALALAGGAWAQAHTLDAESARLAALRQARSPEALPAIERAIVRHPASDHLELLAAAEALARTEPSALKHLGRALALHPAYWQAHHLAARTLASMGHPGQAAVEYRLAAEHGAYIPPTELWAIVRAHAVDAVPQHSGELLELARWLAQAGHPVEADLAGARALEVATRPDTVLRERLRIAESSGGDRRRVVAAAQAIIASHPDAAGWVAAAQALARAGDAAAARQAIADAERAHPEDPGVILAGAQILFDASDLAGARALLKREGDGHFTLAERKTAAELAAQIAERAGDLDAAVLARARARIFARKLEDVSPGGTRVY